MSRPFGLAFIGVLMLVGTKPLRDEFSMYRPVEAYEIRPGILMMPRYSKEGEVCEIGLERLLYSPEEIRLDGGLSRREIDRILDELVPSNERGSKDPNLLRADSIDLGGNSLVETVEYQNLYAQFYASSPPSSATGVALRHNLVATMRWKNRKCQ
jgi:hypothetical protein